MHPPEKIGLIAGNGVIPQLLVTKWLQTGYVPIAATLDSSQNMPHVITHDFSMGQVGGIISFFCQHGVRKLVIVGHLKRPNFFKLHLDAYGLKTLAKIIWRVMGMGDDSLLKFVRHELESAGFEIHPVQEYLPELLCPVGILGVLTPDENDNLSIDTGIVIAKEHGQQDKGQSIVMSEGRVVAKEDEKGTSALIKSVFAPGRKILVKVSKPQQDMALDAPTIGVTTIELLRQNGFAGLVVEAGRTLVVDLPAVITACNEGGLFFVGRNT